MTTLIDAPTSADVDHREGMAGFPITQRHSHTEKIS